MNHGTNRPEATAAIIDGERALYVLELLAGPANGSAPRSLLYRLLIDYGLGCTMDQLMTLLSRLEQAGLVRVEPREHAAVVTLLLAGEETASGVRRTDWVARPLPPTA